MLILARKAGETVIIGNNIHITVVGVKDGQVKIGIDAPKDIAIFRQEVYELIQEENKRAVANKLDINFLTECGNKKGGL